MSLPKFERVNRPHQPLSFSIKDTNQKVVISSYTEPLYPQSRNISFGRNMAKESKQEKEDVGTKVLIKESEEKKVNVRSDEQFINFYDLKVKRQKSAVPINKHSSRNTGLVDEEVGRQTYIQTH